MKKITSQMEEELPKIIKMLYIATCGLFAMPSIVYLLQNGTVYKFENWFEFLLNDTDRVLQTILYLIILASLTTLYFLIVKERKRVFKDNKNIFIFIGVVALIFVLVIPFTCSDVFYYLGIGRINSTYGQNPYYSTIKNFVEQGENSIYLEQDTVLGQGYINDWSDSTVVYRTCMDTYL